MVKSPQPLTTFEKGTEKKAQYAFKLNSGKLRLRASFFTKKW